MRAAFKPTRGLDGRAEMPSYATSAPCGHASFLGDGEHKCDHCGKTYHIRITYKLDLEKLKEFIDGRKPN